MTKDDVEYVTAIIGVLSLKLGRPCSRIYKSIKDAGLIDNYLVKLYDVLHTFSLDYVADDIITLMDKKGLAIGYTTEQALQNLIYQKPNHQLCFITQEAIDRCLKLTGCITIKAETNG